MNRLAIILSSYLIAALIASAGCSTGKSTSGKFAKNWDIRRAIGMQTDEPTPPQVPTRLISTWEDTVLSKQGQKPQRGFGGRLVFFNRESDEAIRVDGQLIVYAFDEADAELKNTQPTRRYVFPREQFARHESPSQIGPAYSVWLPWSELGGEQKNVSLIARFEPHKGPLIAGEQTKHLLPGTSPMLAKSKDEPTFPGNRVRLAQYSATPDADENEKPKERLTTTSIPLSKSWKHRLNQ
ncbi:MAG: hypothetical protein GXP28_00100 [Planctomycetes bacterium]|nr:hypothetical protein [Planctomycetota bacterium]